MFMLFLDLGIEEPKKKKILTRGRRNQGGNKCHKASSGWEWYARVKPKVLQHATQQDQSSAE
jgi:hypothetical protein